MSDISGRTSPSAFAYFDPDSRSLRTSQATFPWASTKSSVTLPPSGSMRNGECFERPRSVPATNVHASSSSPLIGTPRADKWGPPDSHGRVAPFLLPTPAANEYHHADLDGYLERRERVKAQGINGNGFGLVLSAAVRMLPTPTVGDSKSAANRTAERRRKSAHHDGVTLTDAVRLMPTPTTSDAKGPSPSHGGTTAEAVRDLLSIRSVSTDQQSIDTQPPSAEMHPRLWMVEDDSTPDSWSG